MPGDNADDNADDVPGLYADEQQNHYSHYHTLDKPYHNPNVNPVSWPGCVPGEIRHHVPGKHGM